MLLTLAFRYKSLRWLLPATIVISSIPSFVLYWLALRSLTCLLPNRIYRRGDDFLYEIFQRQILFFFQHFSKIKFYVHGSHDEVFSRKESALLISNHQSSADWLVTSILAAKQGSLGHLRLTVKSGLKYFPLIGLYWKMHGYVYIERHESLSNLKRKFSKIEMPSWICLFPEGFRFNSESKDVLAMSRKYAAEYDLPQFEHVLIPRTKVTYAAMSCLKDKIQSLYDICIVYTNNTNDQNNNKIEYLNAPSLYSLLNMESPEVHIHVNRIGIENLMNSIKINNVNNRNFMDDDDIEDADEEISEVEVGNWLINAFEKKDKLLNMLYLHDKTFNLLSNGHLVKLSLKETLVPLLLLTCTTISLMSTKFGRKLYTSIFLYGTVLSFLTIKISKK